MTEVRYVVCPGSVKSQFDGDWHYISVARLVSLYELRPGEWITFDQRRGYDTSRMKFLYPSAQGNYGRPE